MGNKNNVDRASMNYNSMPSADYGRSQTPKHVTDFGSKSCRTVCIVGSGLAGSMMAVLFAKLGFKVCLYEKRNEYEEDQSDNDVKIYGSSKSANKRSINLALSYRGMIALKEVGILDEVMVGAIRMPCRVIHNQDGKTMKQAYGKEDEALYSVGREYINLLLLDRVKKPDSNIKIFFNHSFIKSDKDGTCSFRNEKSKEVITETFDLVIGADGAYSSVRENLLRQGRINFSRQYIAHGYKELSIPHVLDENQCPTYALENPGGLHIWPRGSFMLIALPNPDKSFTATLFAPYEGADGFDSVDPASREAVETYFNRHFPDVVPIIKDSLFQDYRDNPVGSLVTVRTDPWNFGKTVLVGDAAHAVVPFYGQGMNAAFEDTLILYRIIQDAMSTCSSPGAPAPVTTTATVSHIDSASLAVATGRDSHDYSNKSNRSVGSSRGSIGSDDGNDDYVIPSPIVPRQDRIGDNVPLFTSSSTNSNMNLAINRQQSNTEYTTDQVNTVDLMACIKEFARVRTPAANGLSDLCLEHYHDMASNTASRFYLLKKRLELVISSLFPHAFTPLYSMVAFTNIPYHEAVTIAKRQDEVLNQVATAVCASAAAIVTGGVIYWAGVFSQSFYFKL